MEFLPADYILMGITAVGAVIGLFRGVSGALGFVAATAAAGITAAFVWPYSAAYNLMPWVRALVSLVVTLVVFGIVRLVVKKLVNGLLSQPSDSIFGFIFGAAIGAMVSVGWAFSGMFLEYSLIATAIADFLNTTVAS